jgi:integration host factor subunit alpha
MELGSIIKKNTITREFLAKSIKSDLGLPLNQAATLVDQIFDQMVSAINKGKKIKIRMFGTFYSKKKNQRVGRNPKTMKEAVIPARQVVKFKVAPTLKKRINSNIQQIQ